MANLIQKTILHPENSKEIDLYPKTSYEQVEGLDGIIAGINNKIDKIPIGEKVSFVFPKNAANGNITNEQLAKLQASDLNYIEMVNDKELYYLNDPGHEEGFLTYSHVGIENSKATIKTLTITVSAKSFVIVTTVVPTESGGSTSIYRHTLKFIVNKDNLRFSLMTVAYSTRQTEYTANYCQAGYFGDQLFYGDASSTVTDPQYHNLVIAKINASGPPPSYQETNGVGLNLTNLYYSNNKEFSFLSTYSSLSSDSFTFSDKVDEI